MDQHRDALAILREFCEDVQVTGPDNLEQDWPDLHATYQKAQALLGVETPAKAITLLQLASAILGRKAENGADFEEAGVAMWGGCEVCGASIAAYNGCPSRTGYIRCAKGCIEDTGFATVEEARAFVEAQS